MKETALTAINSGSNAPTNGELAMVADETPNKEAMGLAQTPTQAPLLQQDNKIGAADVIPPVMVVQIDFFSFIMVTLILIFSNKTLLKLLQQLAPKDKSINVLNDRILWLELKNE